MKLNKEALERYQMYWKKSQFLLESEKEDLISISNVFLKRVEEKNGEVDDVVLLYPEDFESLEKVPSFQAFREFAGAMDASVVVRPEGGAKAKGWFLNYQVQVE